MSTNGEGSQPVSVRELVEIARYCRAAVLRNRKLGLTCMAVVVGLAGVAALSMPKKYSVAVRILTKRSYIIPSLVSPQRAVPLDSDRPTRGAVETILSYSFREELLDATNLPELAGQHQTRFQRLESNIHDAIGIETDPRKVRAGLTRALGRSLDATLDDGRVLNIVVSWGNPVVAKTLAEELIDLFLRRQKAAELDEIHDTVDIIRRNVLRAHSRLTETTTRLGELVKRKETELTQRLTVRESRERRTVTFRRPAAAPPLETGRGDRQALAQQVRQKERALRRLVDQHEQRMTRARQNLTRLEESLGPRHPDLQAARREVEQVRPVPSEITTAREEIAALRRRQPAPTTAGPAEGGGARFEVVQMPLSEDVYNALQADPEVGHMMEEVRKYANEYASQLDRLEAAELEIDMSNAAFAYRYTVTQPPTYPTKPVASKRNMVLAAGLLLGLFLGLIACVAKDLASGRIRARWQVERLLGTRVLGRANVNWDE